jgi:hypothetical protein
LGTRNAANGLLEWLNRHYEDRAKKIKPGDMVVFTTVLYNADANQDCCTHLCLYALVLCCSERYRDRALMKREKRRGDRTLPWATPVSNVILALPMSLSANLTVVCLYRDFKRSISGIPYTLE